MNPTEKLYEAEAKQIILDIEKEMLETHEFCPYEIAYTIKSIDSAIEFFEKEKNLVKAD